MMLTQGVADQVESSRFWVELSDIPTETKQLWESKFLKADFKSSQMHLTTSEVENRLKLHPLLLNAVEAEWDTINWIVKPHLLLFVDSSGALLKMNGTYGFLQKLQENNISLGTIFAQKFAGINAVSLAIETQQPTCVKGEEHSSELFFQCISVCYPLITSGKLLGYLNLTLNLIEDYNWALILLRKLIIDIEKRLAGSDPQNKHESVVKILIQYGLSAREQDIAWRWLNNQSVFQISKELFITEGTVRNHIKKVYAKTEVCDKGKFIRKFM